MIFSKSMKLCTVVAITLGVIGCTSTISKPVDNSPLLKDLKPEMRDFLVEIIQRGCATEIKQKYPSTNSVEKFATSYCNCYAQNVSKVITVREAERLGELGIDPKKAEIPKDISIKLQESAYKCLY